MAPERKLQIFFFATRHRSLRKAIDALTIDTQVDSIERVHRALQLYGVPSTAPPPSAKGHFEWRSAQAR